MAISEKLKEHYRDNLPAFAEDCLYIRTKQDGVKPFVFNKVQLYVHERLEKQWVQTGKVRAIILKGRQQGVSTYIAARYFHQAVHFTGLMVYILTHLQEATDNLFTMVSRFYELMPAPLRPEVETNSAKELFFKSRESGYKVGTAGSKAVGRSSTIQLFHGSEAAFWANDVEHLAGILQTVPDAPDTEIIFESTANGIGNEFYRKAQDAIAGNSEYQLIFVPWFWDEDYKDERDTELNLSEDDEAYMKAYNLTIPQMRWRAKKIQEMGFYKFQQEYPANPAEAFQISNEDSFIQAPIVIKARMKKALPDVVYKCIMGVDPARYGDDDTAIVIRRGREMVKAELHSKKDTMEVAGLVAYAIQKYKPDAVAIDIGGLGAGVYDRLKEMGYEQVFPVNFGSNAYATNKYVNRRAEMWGLMKEWLHDEPVKIIDNERLHGELIAPLYSYDSNGRLKIEKKEDMKKRGIKSPDVADALALTFAIPMRELLSEREINVINHSFDMEYQSGRDEVSGY